MAEVAEGAEAPVAGFRFAAREHRYLSTACLHATGEYGREDLHRECQEDGTRWDGTHKVAATCKWCGAPCICPCHLS